MMVCGSLYYINNWSFSEKEKRGRLGGGGEMGKKPQILSGN